jgi:DNA-binding HxlR family transcriptional regulator
MNDVVVNCSLESAIHILGGRWRVILVFSLLNGSKRFSDLQKDIGIARRMLTVNLRVLEEAGLVSRTAYAEVPPRVEYELTPYGMELRPLINDLCSWGQKFNDRQEKDRAAPSISSPVE